MRPNYPQQQRGFRGRPFNNRGGGGGMQRGGGHFYNRGGGQQGGNGRPYYKPNPKPFIPHVLFDFVLAEQAFPRVKPAVAPNDDKAFNDALLKRNTDLTPSASEQTQLLNLLAKLQDILEKFVLAPPADFDACQLDEIKQVGSFKKGTLLSANAAASAKTSADLCVVLKTLPTREAVSSLGAKCFEELRRVVASDVASNLGVLALNLNESGFEVTAGLDVAVQVLVTTQQQNIRKLDPALHLDAKICHHSLNSIKHARWFEENASHSTIKVLIRLLKDIRNRFEGLAPLNPWIIDLVAHYAIMNTPKREPLGLGVAFRRIFQLLSAGFFLPGSAGIIDPCENAPTRVHTTMTLEQQDSVCFTFQTLLRVLAHGGYRQILGLEGNASIAISPSVWAGVVVIPSSKAYEPSKETELPKDELHDEGDDEDAEGNVNAAEHTANTELDSDSTPAHSQTVKMEA